MDDLDRSLLNIVQTNFPVEARPYLSLAERSGCTEQEAWQRVQVLRREGIIRRLGGVFDSHRLGYKSTLCVAKVPEEKIDEISDLLLNIPGVTHNYLRNHEYNMWFTLIAPSEAEVEQILQDIKVVLNSEEVYSLPAVRLFKISVDFDFCSDKDEKSFKESINRESDQDQQMPGAWQNGQKPAPCSIDEEDKTLIRILQGNLPDSLQPFQDIGNELHWAEEKVLEHTQNLLHEGVIRRFGAVLRHQKAGFTANAMGVWKVPEDQAEIKGNLMASFREVSHCYQRPTFANWPYNIYTMIHGHSVKDCEDTMEKISKLTEIKGYSMLFSTRELKKSSMQYFMEEDD